MSTVLPSWNFKHSTEDRVMVVLARAANDMTQASITAAIALWAKVGINEAMISLLLDGKIIARFIGDEKADVHDEDNYEFTFPEDPDAAPSTVGSDSVTEAQNPQGASGPPGC